MGYKWKLAFRAFMTGYGLTIGVVQLGVGSPFGWLNIAIGVSCAVRVFATPAPEALQREEE